MGRLERHRRAVANKSERLSDGPGRLGLMAATVPTFPVQGITYGAYNPPQELFNGFSPQAQIQV